MSEIVDCLAYIIRKFFWSLGVFLKFLGLRLLDFLGLICNIAGCCTVIRLPFMIAQFRDMKDMWDWRLIGIVQLLIFIIDVPVILAGCIVFFTVWRVYPCVKELSEEWDGSWKSGDIYFTGFSIRYVVLKHFFTLFVDAFCIPAVIICLLSWRCCIFLDKLRAADTDWKKRKVCIVQMLHVLLDFPLIIMFIPVLLSWRLPFLIKNISDSDDKKWNNIRWFGLYQSMLLIIDIPCIIAFILTLFTWRAPVLVWYFQSVCRNNDISKDIIQFKLRKQALIQFFTVFIDIPCILCFFFVIVTIVHLIPMINKIRRVCKKEFKAENFYKIEFKIRLACLHHFLLFIIDLVCLALAVVVLFTLWRTYPLTNQISNYFKQYKLSKVPKHESVDNSKNDLSKHEKPDPTSIISSDLKNQEVKEEIAVEHESEDNNVKSELENNAEEIVNGNSHENDNTSSKEQKESDLPFENSAEYENIEEETDKPNKTLNWSQFCLKVRKTCVIQFAMLVVDIPAIPLCLLLLVTVIRASKVISGLLGGFYTMFAVTVYYQTMQLFIDLAFLLLFLILICLRPIQAWVHLLEDDEHREYRLTLEFMQWLPDITEPRHQLYDDLQELLTMYIKNTNDGYTVKDKLDSLFSVHFEKIKKFLRKFEQAEIEDEIVYLVKCIQYFEMKRTDKLMKEFTFEKNFMLRPDIKVYNENKLKWESEVKQFKREVNGVYEQLEKYTPAKVPLYSQKSGLLLRSRKESRKVLINCLPKGNFVVIIGAILCMLPIYRAPTMVKKLYQRWYARRGIVYSTFKEYLCDVATLLRILLITVLLYRAPFMYAEIIDCIISKRSWKAVRKTVQQYPPEIAEDFTNLLSLLFTWKTPRFLISAILFSILMPADLFLRIIKLAKAGACCTYVLTFLVYVVFICLPFVLTFYGAEKLLSSGTGWSIMVLVCIFYFALLILVFIMIIALVRDPSKSFLLEMPACDYIRYNWYNIHVILFEILEFFQSIALVFKLTNIPMYGSSELNTASTYLLFSFVPFKVVFWVQVFLIVLWFFISGAPIVLENILNHFAVGTCGKKKSWRLLVSLFTNTLFVTIVENLTSFSACMYPTCPPNYNSTHICTTAQFVEDTALTCWTSPHTGFAVFGMVAFFWFVSTSAIFAVEYGDPDSSEQDIGFSPLYNSIVNVIKAVMVIAMTLITNYNYASLSIVLACAILLVIYTLLFKKLFAYPACNSSSLLVWRVFSFVSTALTAVAVIIAYVQNKSSSTLPLIIIGAGIAVFFVVSVIVAWRLQQASDIQRDRREYQKTIVHLCKKLSENQWLMNSWKEETKVWHRLVNSVREAKSNDKHVDEESWNISPRGTSNEPEVTKPTEDSRNGSLCEDHEITQLTDISCQQQNDSIENNKHAEDEYLDEASTPLQGSLPPPHSYSSVDATTGLPPPPAYSEANAEVNEVRFQEGMVCLRKNGCNLLLLLEKHIHYCAYKYAFLSQRHLWLNAVANSNWTGLLHCVEILAKNIDGTFYRPTPLDVSLSPQALPTDQLPDDDDADDSWNRRPEPFVRLTKETRESTSKELRSFALRDVEGIEPYGKEWGVLFDKVLPTTPVIKEWSFKDDNKFKLTLYKPVNGKITEVEESGNKIAIGAVLSLKKVLQGHFSSGSVFFHSGCQPSGKKSPVSLTVSSVMLFKKKEKIYIEVNGKKIKFENALQSCKTIQWS